MPACRRCIHVIAANRIDGFCHRFPPTVLPDFQSSWPVVHLDKGHCGEFSPGKNPNQGAIENTPVEHSQKGMA